MQDDASRRLRGVVLLLDVLHDEALLVEQRNSVFLHHAYDAWHSDRSAAVDGKRHDDLVEQDECTDRSEEYECECALRPTTEKFLEERFHGLAGFVSNQNAQT